MVIALIITWVLLALITVAVVGRNTHSIEELQDRADGIVKAVKIVQNNSMKTMMELQVTKDEADANSGEIDKIIKRLNEITADIHRLDEEVKAVAKDEHEIRSYYVNFREPKAFGVDWAQEYKCEEDHNG